MTGAEFKKQAAYLIEECEANGFMDKKIMPYGFGITVRDFTRNWKNYDNFTADSKTIMHDELAGFLPIFEHWLEIEDEPQVTVRFLAGKKTGQTAVVNKSFADMLVDDNLAEVA